MNIQEDLNLQQHHCEILKSHKSTIFPVVLFRHDIWFLTQREEYGLRVFKNRVLRKIFGPGEVGGGGQEPN